MPRPTVPATASTEAQQVTYKALDIHGQIGDADTDVYVTGIHVTMSTHMSQASLSQVYVCHTHPSAGTEYTPQCRKMPTFAAQPQHSTHKQGRDLSGQTVGMGMGVALVYW